MIAEATFSLACPRCGDLSIRVREPGEAYRLVGIDPCTGEVRHGWTYDFRTTDYPVPLYFCSNEDCSYANVVKTEFIRED